MTSTSGPASTPAFDLSDRDRSIVQLVARFKQLSSSHIHELLFPDSSSHTPANRALLRLTERGYLLRVERRLVGGSRGGSGQFAYQLGRKGFYLYFEGRFSPWRTVNYHALGIADTYLVLKRLERAGRLSIVGYSTEPDCHVRIGHENLQPDMYMEVERVAGERLKLWFEQDMGTESQTRLRAKLERYWRCYNEADVETWPVFPRTIWVAVDAEREKELRWIVSSMREDARGLFQVTTVAGLPSLFGG